VLQGALTRSVRLCGRREGAGIEPGRTRVMGFGGEAASVDVGVGWVLIVMIVGKEEGGGGG
jgi:hypothetical protein